MGKGGVGLVFDLGEAAEVGSVEIATSTPGIAIEIRAGGSAPETAEDLDVVTRLSEAEATEQAAFAPVEARYWLVWVTELPGDGGGSVEIGEVSFRGRS